MLLDEQTLYWSKRETDRTFGEKLYIVSEIIFDIICVSSLTTWGHDVFFHHYKNLELQFVYEFFV